MTTETLAAEATFPRVVPKPSRPSLDTGFDPRTAVAFFGIMIAAMLFIAYNLYIESRAADPDQHAAPFACWASRSSSRSGFEFVNGFHDTANAVATVIYTHSMPAGAAVVWSGIFNFLGVLASSGAVAYGIIALLPVELILQVGSSAGFAMVFALLIGAIIWNLGTWYLGMPASSSHTLIGSIIGVGLANQLISSGGASGVDWAQASKVGYSLLLSPLVGFGGAGAAAAGSEGRRHAARALRGAEGNDTAAAVDSGASDLDLHRRQLRARIERRSERHGPDHADLDRRRPDRIRIQSGGARQRHAAVHRDVGLAARVFDRRRWPSAWAIRAR